MQSWKLCFVSSICMYFFKYGTIAYLTLFQMLAINLNSYISKSNPICTKPFRVSFSKKKKIIYSLTNQNYLPLILYISQPQYMTLISLLFLSVQAVLRWRRLAGWQRRCTEGEAVAAAAPTRVERGRQRRTRREEGVVVARREEGSGASAGGGTEGGGA